MTVRPTQSGQTSQPGIARSARPAPAAPASSSAQSGAAGSPRLAGDDVRISDEARALRDLATRDHEGDSELSPERLREISQRIVAGHYDREDVADATVRRLLRDL